MPRHPWTFPGYRLTSSAAESRTHFQNFTLPHDLYHFQGTVGAQVQQRLVHIFLFTPSFVPLSGFSPAHTP